MKPSPILPQLRLRAAALLCALCGLCLGSGCVTHQLPKDAYLKGVKSKISTPWGTGELDVAEAATGTAAKDAAKK